MGNFRSDNRNRGRGFGRGRGDERRGGFRDGGGRRDRMDRRDRDSRGFGRRLEMHEVTCDKCGKQCEVPFRPTGDKPVFCSDCFRKEGNSGSRVNQSSSGISKEQFNELNAKLDKILGILENIEFEEAEEESEEDEEDDSKEDS